MSKYNREIWHTKYYLPKRAEKIKAAVRNARGKKKRCDNYRGMVVSLLLQRDGEFCGICHQELTQDLEIDHIRQVAHGGTDEASNLRLTHSTCNRRRSRVE